MERKECRKLVKLEKNITEIMKNSWLKRLQKSSFIRDNTLNEIVLYLYSVQMKTPNPT